MTLEAMKFAILNDTSIDLHHGCSRVMDTLCGFVQSHGAEVLVRVPRKCAWWKNTKILDKLRAADAIIINGEGTLHHGRPAARDLLRVVEHPSTRDKPLHLLNALYQENPAEWAPLLDAFHSISPRDSLSAGELRKLLERPVSYIPDLTLCAGPISCDEPRHMEMVVGDSVDESVSAALASLAKENGAQFVPSLSRLKTLGGKTGLSGFNRRLRRKLHEMKVQIQNPQLQLARDTQEYAAALCAAKLHVTGRFHGVCYSIITGTPFIASTSNSWKIEALVSDFGLDPERVIPIAAVPERIRRRDWSFSEVEKANIRNALANAKTDAEILFDEICAPR